MEELQVATGFHPGCDKPRNINQTVNDTFRHATNEKAANFRPPLFVISNLNRAPKNGQSRQGAH
ncbi:MAG TPA: hypothetical protein DDZ43_10005 [Hyphomonadaceae bacterium]|nr:hypothetical protein [Ponticaulis sp.]HBJ93198.1 hypothetical protein [Hyphomonadaceae bacterium]